uniref:Uncharacterized protein n=1 Tax=Oryza glumipatula TaxID=40148 RepID=A0A0D9YEF1_9ORYZ
MMRILPARDTDPNATSHTAAAVNALDGCRSWAAAPWKEHPRGSRTSYRRKPIGTATWRTQAPV